MKAKDQLLQVIVECGVMVPRGIALLRWKEQRGGWIFVGGDGRNDLVVCGVN